MSKTNDRYVKQVYLILASLNTDQSVTNWFTMCRRMDELIHHFKCEKVEYLFAGRPVKDVELELANFGTIVTMAVGYTLSNEGKETLDYFVGELAEEYGNEVKGWQAQLAA